MPSAQILRFVAVPHYERSYAGGFDFNWDVRAVGFAPAFRVQAQEAEGEPWVDVLDAPVTAPYVAGVGPRQLSFQGDGHFRLLVQDAATSVLVVQSNPIDARYQMERGQWLKYREMLRRERLQIEKLSGLPGFLLRRIVYGVPCAACVSPITGDVVSTECDVCYGTGFVGGYYTPFPMWADWGETPPTLGDATRQDQGVSEAAKTSVIVAAFPHVQFEDVYVDRGSGQRFTVLECKAVTFRSAPVKQLLSLSRLPPSHRAYDVPVPGL